MTTTPAPNPRASLLAGLRTGGVRSTSMNVPHTAAPTGAFNLPRMASQNFVNHYPEDEDEVGEMVDHAGHPHNRSGNGRHHQPPMTAAVDGPFNGFQQQQQQELMRQAALQRATMNGQYGSGDIQAQAAAAQALQMQMMQMEIIRLQALQQQSHGVQYNVPRRASQGFLPPATAGPLNTSFDLRSTTMPAQLRARQGEQLHTPMAASGEEQVPMTAALGGKFGSRSLNPNATAFRFGGEGGNDYPNYGTQTPTTPNFTTVISGGTSLGVAGNGSSNNVSIPSVNSGPSKSDAAISWRRGGNNNSVLRQPSPNVKVTPPSGECVVPPPPSSAKFRPQPLQISSVPQPLPTIAVDVVGDTGGVEDDSSTNSNSNSSPTTSDSTGSIGAPQLSPREEASKRLYEGLGMGRPAPAPATPIMRLMSQPMRQPRGPPSNNEELAPKNFASRIRRQAIGGLGVLMDARKRSEMLEVL